LAFLISLRYRRGKQNEKSSLEVGLGRPFLSNR